MGLGSYEHRSETNGVVFLVCDIRNLANFSVSEAICQAF